MKRGAKQRRAFVGVADHGGWAVLMTVGADGKLLDRRRVELIEAGLPCLPHHHEGQALPLADAVALVRRVSESAARSASARLDELAADVSERIAGIALRIDGALPATVEERITNYRAMCAADWVMYRGALAAAADARGWSIQRYDAEHVLELAARAMGRDSIDEHLAETRAVFGPPWQKDHRVAMAAAISCIGGSV